MFFVARANVTITDSLFKNGNAATAGKKRRMSAETVHYNYACSLGFVLLW